MMGFGLRCTISDIYVPHGRMDRKCTKDIRWHGEYRGNVIEPFL